MLNKENIYQATKKAIKSMPFSQAALAEKIGMYPPHLSSKMKSSDQITQLMFLQELADAMEIDVEQLVLPGLTEAEKYGVRMGDLTFSGTNKKGAASFGNRPFSKNINEGGNELALKLYECQQEQISLIKENARLKEEIFILKNGRK